MSFLIKGGIERYFSYMRMCFKYIEILLILVRKEFEIFQEKCEKIYIV